MKSHTADVNNQCKTFRNQEWVWGAFMFHKNNTPYLVGHELVNKAFIYTDINRLITEINNYKRRLQWINNPWKTITNSGGYIALNMHALCIVQKKKSLENTLFSHEFTAKIILMTCTFLLCIRTAKQVPLLLFPTRVMLSDIILDQGEV